IEILALAQALHFLGVEESIVDQGQPFERALLVGFGPALGRPARIDRCLPALLPQKPQQLARPLYQRWHEEAAGNAGEARFRRRWRNMGKQVFEPGMVQMARRGEKHAIAAPVDEADA